MSPGPTVFRRGFVSTMAAGTSLLVCLRPPTGRLGEPAAEFAPNAFVEIAPDGQVTIHGFRSEMGQGVLTAIAMLVADELEADWRRVRVEQAVADPRYDMGTAGSRSIRQHYLPLRAAGAATREVLLTAASQSWQVPREQLVAREGAIRHEASGRRAGYGELVGLARTLPVPKDPPLKPASQFRFIGQRIPRLDTPAKVDGSARFGIDVRVPGMRYACLLRPPVFGAELVGFDQAAARRLAGVRAVVRVDHSVAVVADSSWAAMRALAQVKPRWGTSQHADLNSASITEQLRRLLGEPGVVARKEGDALGALEQAAGASPPRRIEAEYQVPYLAHATMEPQNCTADIRADRAELWVPTQSPQRCQQLAVELTGLPPQRVTVHTTYLGGGFGRRGQTDFVREAILVSQAIGAPVQVLWSREDDMRHDFYRPATANRFAGAVNAAGRIVGWRHQIAGQSLRARSGALPPDGVDPSSVEGAANLPYSIANILVDYHRLEGPVPIGPWRSVGSSQNAFVTEGFMDELAALAGADPFAFRRDHLTSPRARTVLELAAAKAGWGTPLGPGRFRGIAFAASYGTLAAEVVEVSVADARVRVHRVVCAVDCGQVVNPDTVEAQMEGGIVYGLTAALYGEITVEQGRVVQGNFHDYPLLRLPEMPVIEVHIVPSSEAPGGVGEPGTPPIAPAVANAVFAATGVRIRRLPIRL